jgi:mono/diheme cytochrome c family protein
MVRGRVLLVFTTLVAVIVLAVVVGAAVIMTGVYDVAATTPHWSVTEQLIGAARVRSIKARAKGIQVPTTLGNEQNVIIGTEHFAAHCAVCHGAPGVPAGDIAHGLYPKPPNLAESARLYSEGELFWIIKHGIKMTGMPAWPDHSDEEIWATVAFLKKLPGMTEQEYARLVMAAMSHGGHHGAAAAPAGPSEPAPAAGEHRH